MSGAYFCPQKPIARAFQFKGQKQGQTLSMRRLPAAFESGLVVRRRDCDATEPDLAAVEKAARDGGRWPARFLSS
jgi:hypothetical protein